MVLFFKSYFEITSNLQISCKTVNKEFLYTLYPDSQNVNILLHVCVYFFFLNFSESVV